MMRLFLVEKSSGRCLDLGAYKFNDEKRCIAAAQQRHPMLAELETDGFYVSGQLESGPLRLPKQVDSLDLQLSLVP